MSASLRVSSARPAPSDEARARLRDEAASLDVEDIVDLCCSRTHDRLRVSLYLEALRTRPSAEKAQLAACLLCFDLARHGDEARELELHLLLPVVDSLVAADPVTLAARPEGKELPSVVRALTDKSDAVLELWRSLVEHAAHRDHRAAMPVPDDDDIEVALFDAADMVELDLSLEDLAIDFDDIAAADDFDRAVDAVFVPVVNAGLPLFAAGDRGDVERVERLKASAQSFAAAVPVAAELHAITALFLASHTRAKGLFGRRNKQRDRLLSEALEAFLRLPEPPAAAAGWFAASDVPGAEPFAWEKMAEVLIDFAGFAGKAIEDGLDPTLHGFVENVVDAYVKDPRSAKVAPVLAAPGAGRRR